jgi:prepilin-type N-terminal cleavage/methylation domain-containing protein
MRPRRGFTLVELMVVVAVIGIIIALIMRASYDAVRTSEIKATQALISKLENALTDRMDALSSYRIVPNLYHATLATSSPSAGVFIPPLIQVPGSSPAVYIPQITARAQVFAQYDYLRAELPDVWIPMDTTNITTNYAINFGGVACPGGTSDAAYVLPIGNAVSYASGGANLSGAVNAGTGIYGASYAAASGIYKQLGFAPTGYDGQDNNSDGLVDDVLESGMTLAQIQAKIGSHTHATARSEMLYAILVEGTGPLGSSFSRDDFGPNEVADTDGDGLMEFVDAWGQPIQFYRWPIFYKSDIQKGVTIADGTNPPTGPYDSVYERREQDALDPNQQLMAPLWWGSGFNSQSIGGFAANGPLSAGANAFQSFFHLLVEPGAVGGNASSLYWDRGATYYQRRAFYTRPLIISGGPDKEVGIYTLTDAKLSPTVANAIVEGMAIQGNFGGTAPYFWPTNFNPPKTSGEFLQDVAGDDISSHNINAPGGIVQ